MKFGTYTFPNFCLNQWKITFLSQFILNFSFFTMSNVLFASTGINFPPGWKNFYEYGTRFVKIDPLLAD